MAKPAKIKREKLEDVIDQYLFDQHCTMFGRGFDIRTGNNPRVEAIEFFANFFEAVNDCID